MFLRCHSRKKNGKPHRYWSVVESRRLAGGNPAQRQVLYLGEINDHQEAAWRKTVKVFDEQRNQSREVSLFPSDRAIPSDQANALSVVLTEMRLVRPRSFGDCWLGCRLWEELGLNSFWREKLAGDRGGVPWEKVLQLLAVNRLCEPGSEFAVHRSWFLRSAMDELLGVDFAVAEKDRLYRCLDRILPHKDELCRFLVQRWKTLFDASFDVLLYDLTSTYFEGQCEQIPKARHGYSRDGRPDCRQVVIALVVTTDGLPLAYEVLAGNTADKTTLRIFLSKIEAQYGKARRVWVMDRGVPTEATLEQMRADDVAYLVGTPRHLLSKLEKDLIDKPWEQVHEGMAVKLLEQEDELYVQAKSSQRQKKENAMRRRKLKTLVNGLNRLKRRKNLTRDHLLERVAVLRKEAGRVASFIDVRKPLEGEPVNRKTFTCAFNRSAWKQAMERDGCYILRAHVPWEDWPAGMEKAEGEASAQAQVLWEWYMQLVRVEEAFKTLKSDLNLRPIHHQIEKRVEAHIMVAFLGYCLSVTLRMKLSGSAPGLTPRAALQSLSGIQMMEVHLPTTDGRVLVMPRHTEPEAEQKMILDVLKLELPPQPPPRIREGKVEMPERSTPANL
jgi:transposase